MSENPSSLDLDLLAASLRVDEVDVGTYVEALAVKLQGTLGDAVRVYRWRERMFGPKRVHKITVDGDGERMEMRVGDDGALETSCARVSGGIVLKTEPVDPDAWLRSLVELLARRAQRSRETREALERLLAI